MALHPNAGKPATTGELINLPRLITQYFTDKPDPAERTQRVSFGTSGHRGSSLTASFNEDHILATTQAICLYRHKEGITGPVFMGMDTHALSEPAQATALEVLAGNEVPTMIAANNEYAPTPAVSHAILTYNAGRTSGLADGIIITPSHNPPQDGGFKYNMTNGGPAVSLILAFMNLLPIPALDGGHVMFLLYEMITGRKPSDKFLERATIVGFVIVIGLVLYANGLDIIRSFFS